MRVPLLILCLIIATPAFAEWGWKESPLWRSASVLNSGQHQWSLRAGQQTITNRYDVDGQSQPLGKSFNKEWKWQEILSTEKDINARAALLEYMKSNGITQEDVAASSTVDVKREEVLMDFSWAYGMSDRWTFGVFFPISKITTKANPKINVRPEAVAAIQKTQKSKLTKEGAGKLIEQKVQDHIASQGFRTISETSERWVWGDLSLMNQYLFYKDVDQKASIQQVLRFPTSRNASLSDYVQSSYDEGQIDLGLSIYFDQIIGRVTATASGGYLNQLPGPVRVTELNEDGQREGDVEVTRNLGDIWWAGADTVWRLTRNIQIGGGYRYFWKEKDRYDRTHSVRVDSIQGQDMHLARVGAHYVFDPLDATRYEIEKKWAVGLEFQTPIAGRNSEQAASATLDLQTYF